MQAMEVSQQGGDVKEAEGLHKPDAHRAANDPFERGRDIASLLDRGERPTDRGQKRLARVGERDPVRVAVEQAEAEVALQGLDRDREGGLDIAETLRRAGEAVLLGDSDEVLELPDFHETHCNAANE
jgi:hypothetical protein